MKLLITLLMSLAPMPCLLAQESDSTDYVADSTYQEDEGVQKISPDQLPSTAEYKLEKLQIKKFDHEAWKNIVGSTNYEEKPPEIKAPRAPLFRLSPWSSGVLKVITYALIIGVALFIVYYVIKNASIGSIRAKNAASSADNFPDVEDNIEEFDMEEQLRIAHASGDLRLVVRIHYLGLLKKLNEEEKIVWKKDKTNLDYLMELFSNNYFYEDVRKLTMAYEIMWYGERTITREPFEQLIRDFESLQLDIQNTK